MPTLNEFLDKAMDGVEIMDEGYASVHTNKEIESKLSKVGFKIPSYPKTGDVTLNGEVVGKIDNFNGLMISSKEALSLIKKTLPKVGIWNPNNVK